MTTLTAQIASSGNFIPKIAEDGVTMNGLDIQLMLNWVDSDGVPQATTQRTFDAWSMLSDEQRVALQDIRNTIGAAVMGQV
jgi:hypothetical protein